MKAHRNSVLHTNDVLGATSGLVDRNAAEGVSVTVKVASLPIPGQGALADIFNVNEGVIANPHVTDENGNYLFKAASGIYDVVINEGGPNEYIEAAVDLTLSSGNSSFISFSDFEVDPTGDTDSTDAIQEAINYAQTNGVELRGNKGIFKISQALMIPKNRGFRWTMIRGCVLDASAATTAFHVIDAYSDRTVGVSSDYTEGLVIDGGMIKPSPIAGSYGIAFFYVLNTSRLSNIEVRGGANSILCSKVFYGYFDNIKVKDAAGIGFHVIGLSVDSGFNANPMQGIFATGCGTNFLLDDSESTSNSNAISCSNCTFENSQTTSVVILGSRPVKFVTCYFESNHHNGAAAGECVDIAGDNATIELDNCFINVNTTGHDAEANSVGLTLGGGLGGGLRIVDKNTYKRRGVLTNFYKSDAMVTYENDAPNSDMSNPGGQYDSKRNTGALTRRNVLMDTITMAKTMAPVAGNLANIDTVSVFDPRAPVTLLEIDLTTAQLRSGWTFTISAIAFESNSVNLTRRGGSIEIHVSVFKDGTVFNAYGDILNERALLGSLYGEWFFQHDGVSKVYLGFAPLHSGTPFRQDVQYQVHDMVCRTNADIVSINTNPAVPMPNPAPTVVVKATNRKTFLSGVVTISASGGGYVKDTSYDSVNFGTVSRYSVLGVLDIRPSINSISALKGIPTVTEVQSVTSDTPYLWKIRTFTAAGRLLIYAYDISTGASVDIGSLVGTHHLSVTLETPGGL